MSGPVDLEAEPAGALGDAGALIVDEILDLLAQRTAVAWAAIETTLGDAGWYGGGRDPYPAPAIPFDAPSPVRSPVVDVDRRLWLSRYNQADPDCDVPDVADDTKFPWGHPRPGPATAGGCPLSTPPAGGPPSKRSRRVTLSDASARIRVDAAMATSWASPSLA